MGQRHIQTRVPDTLAERIDTFQENEGFMNDAEAIRHLLRAGLEAETEDTETTEDDNTDGTRTIVERIASGEVMQIATILMLTSALAMLATNYLLTTGYTTVGVLTAGIATLLLILAAITSWAAAIAQIVLARPLRELVIPRWVRA